MKRKRGHKKVKPKKTPVVGANEAVENAISPNTDENSGINNNDEHEPGMAIDTPSSTGTDQLCHLANMKKTDGSVDKTAGKPIGRVKVKLRTSKTLDSQRTSSDAATKSDTDKSNLQPGLEKQGVVPEKIEDSANSMPEMKNVIGNPSKRTGSIKIRSSKGSGSSNIHQISNAQLPQSESPHKKETKISHRDHRYNKQELNSALTVIKKVMNMDAAEPFNVPVNPVALGIPDYFDVIDTPMDFGTICSNLEGGGKYMNSEDVFKDVQYIWENCYKYNNKGDYILDLMRRVKKNFMKYWTAAGLYIEQSKGSNGSESTQAENAEASSLGKVHGKGGQSKQTKKKGHGMRRHKNDCLCAICILKRRRKEREENERVAKGLTGVSDSPAQEENSLGESPCGEDISSDMEDSLDQNVDPGLEEKGEEVKLEATKQQHSPPVEEDEEMEEGDEDEDEEENETLNNDGSETPGQSQFSDKPAGEPNKQVEKKSLDKSAIGQQIDAEKADVLSGLEKDTAAIQQWKHKEAKDKRLKDNMHDNLRFENPMLLGLCDILFPQNCKSIWSGPHSLVRHQGSARVSAIHEAIQTFMK